MLDDDHSRLIELADQLPAGVQIDDVVVTQLLTLQLPGVGDAFAAAVRVQGSLLVRIFPVTQRLQQRVDDADRRRHLFLRKNRFADGCLDAFECSRNPRIVSGGNGECRLRQPPASGPAQAS